MAFSLARSSLTLLWRRRGLTSVCSARASASSASALRRSASWRAAVSSSPVELFAQPGQMLCVEGCRPLSGVLAAVFRVRHAELQSLPPASEGLPAARQAPRRSSGARHGEPGARLPHALALLAVARGDGAGAGRLPRSFGSPLASEVLLAPKARG